MAIGGANGIGFDANVPPATEGAGSGFARIQSIKTSVQQALDSEHNFPSGGGDNIGYHRLGSCRPYYGTQSQVSSSGSDSRLMLTSDTSRLFAVGSGGTVLLGGPYVLSVGSHLGVTWPQRSRIVMEMGRATTGSAGSVLIAFPNSGFSGVPVTTATITTSVVGIDAKIQTVAVDGASFIAQTIGAGSTFVGNIAFDWMSIGTRAL